jgi:hypothetical protein
MRKWTDAIKLMGEGVVVVAASKTKMQGTKEHQLSAEEDRETGRHHTVWVGVSVRMLTLY